MEIPSYLESVALDAARFAHIMTGILGVECATGTPAIFTSTLLFAPSSSLIPPGHPERLSSASNGMVPRRSFATRQTRVERPWIQRSTRKAFQFQVRCV